MCDSFNFFLSACGCVGSSLHTCVVCVACCMRLFFASIRIHWEQGFDDDDDDDDEKKKALGAGF